MAPAVTAQSSTMPRGHVASQDANLNTGAYRTLDNELADWIAAGGEVRLEVRLGGYEGGRPGRIDVEYEVVNPRTNEVVFENDPEFPNMAGQTYERVRPGQIASMMGS